MAVVGMKFDPSDEDLVSYYLHRKVNNQPLPLGYVVDCEVYGDKNPWEIFDKDSIKPFYVFTTLKKKKDNHSNVIRTAGIGTWKGQNKKPFKDDNGNSFWFKKDFVFEFKDKKSASKDHGRWLMVEYSLKDEGVNSYVLCKIWNKYAKDLKKKNEPIILQDFSAVGNSCGLTIDPCMENKRKHPADESEEDQNSKRMRITQEFVYEEKIERSQSSPSKSIAETPLSGVTLEENDASLSVTFEELFPCDDSAATSILQENENNSAVPIPSAVMQLDEATSIPQQDDTLLEDDAVEQEVLMKFLEDVPFTEEDDSFYYYMEQMPPEDFNFM